MSTNQGFLFDDELNINENILLLNTPKKEFFLGETWENDVLGFCSILTVDFENGDKYIYMDTANVVEINGKKDCYQNYLGTIHDFINKEKELRIKIKVREDDE